MSKKLSSVFALLAVILAISSSLSVSTASAKKGLMVGVYEPTFPPTENLTNLEKQLGGEFDIISWYQPWDNPSVNKPNIACKLGKTPLVTWESWNGRSESGNPYPLGQIAAGAYDELIIKQLYDLSRSCLGPIWIRFDHEMNTPAGDVRWYPWQGDPENYVAAWRHIVDLARANNLINLYWVWNPAWGNHDALAYWPGGEYVDYVGLTVNQYYRTGENWYTWTQVYGDDKDVIESFGKPIIIAETATGEGPSASAKAEWISEMLATAEANELIVAVVWFNEFHSREFKDVNFRIDSSVPSLRAFKNYMSNR